MKNNSSIVPISCVIIFSHFWNYFFFNYFLTVFICFLRLIFKNPAVGIISVFPTAIFIYRGSKPLVFGINSWIDRKRNEFVDSKEVVDTEVVSKEEA